MKALSWLRYQSIYRTMINQNHVSDADEAWSLINKVTNSAAFETKHKTISSQTNATSNYDRLGTILN